MATPHPVTSCPALPRCHVAVCRRRRQAPTELVYRREKIGSVVQSVLHVDARDLTFVEQPDGTRSRQTGVQRPARGVMTGIHAAIAPDHVLRPVGPYSGVRARTCEIGGPLQLRIALRDLASRGMRSASQFIDVPDISKGRLALSGLFIQSVRQPAHSAAGGASQEDIRRPRLRYEPFGRPRPRRMAARSITRDADATDSRSSKAKSDCIATAPRCSERPQLRLHPSPLRRRRLSRQVCSNWEASRRAAMCSRSS